MIIYLYTNKINKKKYIGQAQNLPAREATHKYNAKHKKSNMAIDYAISKYGYENFLLEIIEHTTEELVNDRETFWINKLNTLAPNGYNIAIYGAAPIRGRKQTEEARAKISKATSGENHWNFGGTLSEEHKAAISAAHKDKPLSEEHKNKISIF